MAAWLVKPKSGIAKNASRHTIPALVSQCTMSRTSTQVGIEARATTNCASVPLSRAGRNKFSIPIISDNNAAIHTAGTPSCCSNFGSVPIASGNKVMIIKNNTSGYNHCTLFCCLICHSRCHRAEKSIIAVAPKPYTRLNLIACWRRRQFGDWS